MVRKQLYLEEAQDKALKRRAKELGVSEAEVVRQALDAALHHRRGTTVNQQAIEAFLARAEALAAQVELPVDYRFDRQALYEDEPRFTRWEETD